MDGSRRFLGGTCERGAGVDVKVTTTELGDGRHLSLLARCRFRHVQWPAVPFAGRTTAGNDTSLVPSILGLSVSPE